MKDLHFPSRYRWTRRRSRRLKFIHSSRLLNRFATLPGVRSDVSGPMKKIVLIEDDSDLYSLLQYNLEKEGFQMTGSKTGKGAIELCRSYGPDLVLLDIMLPDSDGLDICKGIRSHPELADIPVIFLTARASETDRIVGLELGANDYIVKPFFIRELIARIKIHFRGPTSITKVLRSGDLELDRGRCQVRLADHEVTLTATEFRLL